MNRITNLQRASRVTPAKRAAVLVTALGIASLFACSGNDRESFEAEKPPLTEPDAGPAPEEPSCVEALAETRRAVDIIISIDQSGSMVEEIDSLKANVNVLPSLLADSGLDYRVVMIAEKGRSKYGVCVPPPLGGSECGPNEGVFRPVDQLVTSTDSLALILSTLDHPVAKLAWKDFLRPGVLKVFVPITDDESLDIKGEAFDGELLRRGAPLFGTPADRNYIFFPVIGANDYPSTRGCSSAYQAGDQYQYLAMITKGRWFSVCKPSLAPVLEAIGKATREAVSCEIAIPNPPEGNTLDLEHINVRITPGTGEPAVVPQDSTRPCASGADGWQFSEDKKKIVLCGSACNAVKDDTRSKFNVGFGCKTIVR